MKTARAHPILLVWLCFLVRCVFYSSVVPLWEGFDEPWHFSYIQQVSLEKSLPDSRNSGISREVVESLRAAPLPWMLRGASGPGLPHEQWWRLPAGERLGRERALRELRPQAAGDPYPAEYRQYEAQQPPLFYALAAIPYRLVASRPLVDRVWWLRVFGAAMASLVIPLGFLVAREVLQDGTQAAGVMCLAAAMPELPINLCRVSNETLAIVVMTLLQLLLVRGVRGFRCGLVTGFGLLTKAYFLTALPVLACLTRAPSAIAAVALAAGWHYARNWILYHSISGMQQEVALSGMPLADLLKLIPQVDWWSALDSTFLSHIWFGGWSFVQARSWMYHVFAVLYGMAAAGLARHLLVEGNRRVCLLLGLYVSFGAGVAYHVLLTFATSGVSASTGWYVYALVVAECILLRLGLGPALFCLSGLCFTALELFATHFYLLPYYAGFLAHDGRGMLHAMRLSQLSDEGLARLFEHLAVNKPAAFTAPVLFGLWLLYLVATVTLAAANVRWALAPSRLRAGGADDERPVQSHREFGVPG